MSPGGSTAVPCDGPATMERVAASYPLAPSSTLTVILLFVTAFTDRLLSTGLGGARLGSSAVYMSAPPAAICCPDADIATDSQKAVLNGALGVVFVHVAP